MGGRDGGREGERGGGRVGGRERENMFSVPASFHFYFAVGDLQRGRKINI